jgi:transposase
MKPYSQDFRERIVREVGAQAESQPEIAEHFAVSLSCVEKLWRRWRTTGHWAAQPPAGGRQRRLRGAAALLRAAVAHDPDITLAVLCERVEQAGHPRVSPKTMCVELPRLRLPLKKRRSTPVSAPRRG